MHHDALPIASSPTDTPHQINVHDVDEVRVYDPILSAMTSALMVAQSGILSVEDVAAVLRCSVDTVRRVPVDELPSYDGPGRGILYRMEEVQGYLRRQKRHHKRRSGLGHPANARPVPKAGAHNLAADALKGLSNGVSL
jgi:hypothetical protein